MSHIDEKLDRIESKVANIDVTLAKQQVSLDYHILRTDMLEEKIKPIETHMTELKGVVKLLKLVGVFVGILEALHFWRH